MWINRASRGSWGNKRARTRLEAGGDEEDEEDEGDEEDEEDEEVNSKLYLICSLFPVPRSLT